MKEQTAIYPGTFDPITLGHIDVIVRAATIFNKLIVGVAQNKSKKTVFSVDERLSMAKEALKEYNNITVLSFDELLIDFARNNNANVIIRGLRAVADFEYEYQLASMNRRLAPTIETVFLTPSGESGSISSTLVREISAYGGDVSGFVPNNVIPYLQRLTD